MNRRDFIRNLLLVPAAVALRKVKPKEEFAYGTLEQIVEIEEEVEFEGLEQYVTTGTNVTANTTNAMLVDWKDGPSTFYVLGEGGRLIETHDWGVTWEEVTA